MNSIADAIFHGVTSGLVVYLTIWTYVWFRKGIDSVSDSVRSEIMRSRLYDNGLEKEHMALDRITSLEKELRLHYWEQVKDVDYALGDALKVRGQWCRITDIKDEVSTDKKQVITITAEGAVKV